MTKSCRTLHPIMSRSNENKGCFGDVVESIMTAGRPPQLKMANRAGRSGCGCKCTAGGNEGGNEIENTRMRSSAVDEGSPEAETPEEAYFKGSGGVENLPSASPSPVIAPKASRVYDQLQFIRTQFGQISLGEGGFGHLARPIGFEDFPHVATQIGSPNSMANEATTFGRASCASSVIMSIRSETPRQLLYHIGSWNDARCCSGMVAGFAFAADEDGSPQYPTTIAEDDLH